MDVLAVAVGQHPVNNAIEALPVCKCADVTDKEAVKRLGIVSVDTAIICMANN